MLYGRSRPYTVLFHAAQHLMGTGAGENDHQVGGADLVLKVGGHLCEDLGFASAFGTYILVPCCHTVVAAYDHYTHFILLFYHSETAVRETSSSLTVSLSFTKALLREP